MSTRIRIASVAVFLILVEAVAALPALVYPPGQKIEYSNAGVAVLGYALEVTQGEPFASWLENRLLTAERSSAGRWKSKVSPSTSGSGGI